MEKPKLRLKIACSGDLITASRWNELIQTVNEVADAVEPAEVGTASALVAAALMVDKSKQPLTRRQLFFGWLRRT